MKITLCSLLLFSVSMLLGSCSTDDTSLSYNIDGIAVKYIETGPVDSTQPTVLLLHGASFNAETWQDLGVLDALAEKSIHSVAVDLPESDAVPDSSAKAEFLRELITSADRGKGVVVVSPSMSGSYSLALLAEDGSDAMTGFVAVAPVEINQFAAKVSDPIPLETLAIWGGDDDIIPVEESTVLLDQFDSGKLEILSDAGHAPYRTKPIVFANAVEKFVRSLG